MSFTATRQAPDRSRAVAPPLEVSVDYSAAQTVTVRLTVDFQVA